MLLLPKAFKNGGYLLSPIALSLACLFECTCAIKLSQCGNRIGKASYTEIIFEALGSRVQNVFQIIIAFVQFTFTISQLAFVIESIDSSFDLDNKYFIAIGMLFIFGPIACVRRIEKFRFAFMFGVAMIAIAVITISGFCIFDIQQRGYEQPEVYYAVNHDRYWDMIGFSFFMFEGIGSVMPVMNACNDKAKAEFPYLIAAALITLCSIYILFSELCYYNFGDGLKESIVMQEMPSENRLIQVVKVLYCFNIMFSYPLTIYPTNIVLDSILFRKPRYWIENFVRLVVLILGMVLAISFYD